MYFIQHCFICRPSDATVSEDAEIDPGLLLLLQWKSDALTTGLDLIHKARSIHKASSHPQARSHPQG
jgi:hypothetical protein